MMTDAERDLADHLIALALMCDKEGTDNCDITLNFKNGILKCHIEFSDGGDNAEDNSCN